MRPVITIITFKNTNFITTYKQGYESQVELGPNYFFDGTKLKSQVELGLSQVELG